MSQTVGEQEKRDEMAVAGEHRNRGTAEGAKKRQWQGNIEAREQEKGAKKRQWQGNIETEDQEKELRYSEREVYKRGSRIWS